MTKTKHLTDEELELAQRLVSSEALTESKIKAAYDYQRSVGGSLSDILVKLGMLRRSQIEALMTGAKGLYGARQKSAGATVLQESDVVDTTLKIHHRILDKLPIELVYEYVIVVFFPPSALDSRKLVVGHGKELPLEVVRTIRATFGVEIYTLTLDIHTASTHLVKYVERAGHKLPDWLRSIVGDEPREPEVGSEGRYETVQPEPPVELEMLVEPEPSLAAGGGAAAITDNDDSGKFDLERSKREVRESPEASVFEEEEAAANPPPPGELEESAHCVPSRPIDESSSALGISQHEWAALLSLLTKKMVISRHELDVERELLRRQS